MKFHNIIYTSLVLVTFILIINSLAIAQPLETQWDRFKTKIFGNKNSIEIGFFVSGSNFDYSKNNCDFKYIFPWHGLLTPREYQSALNVNAIQTAKYYLPVYKHFPYFDNFEYQRTIKSKIKVGLGQFDFYDLNTSSIPLHVVDQLSARYMYYKYLSAGIIIKPTERIHIHLDLLFGERDVNFNTTLMATPLFWSINGEIIAYTYVLKSHFYTNKFLSPRINFDYQLKKSPLHFGLRVNPIFNFGLDHHSLPKYGFNASLYLGINF